MVTPRTGRPVGRPPNPVPNETVSITVPVSDLRTLRRRAQANSLPLGTYCRLILMRAARAEGVASPVPVSASGPVAAPSP